MGSLILLMNSSMGAFAQYCVWKVIVCIKMLIKQYEVSLLTRHGFSVRYWAAFAIHITYPYFTMLINSAQQPNGSPIKYLHCGS